MEGLEPPDSSTETLLSKVMRLWMSERSKKEKDSRLESRRAWDSENEVT
ncbi:hypothetical protein ACN28I_02605 [Archangium gephyra]